MGIGLSVIDVLDRVYERCLLRKQYKNSFLDGKSRKS